MTKKDKILQLFNSIDWIQEEFKIITYTNFREAGLGCTIEYGEKYCDIIYAQRIFKKMGFTTAVGMAFYIYKNSKH